jgi:diketogulonate reductase-like aldo/keto reductase
VNRRTFLCGLTLGTLGALLSAEAQRPTKVPRIGVLGGGSASGTAVRIGAFRRGLRELGYVEGKNIVIEELWAEGRADRLHVVRSGKVRYLGASNFHAWQLMKAIGLQRANGWSTFVSIQNFYNLLNREEEREMLPLCLSEGVGAIPWSPLARGRLTRPWSDEPPTARAESDTYARSLFARTAAIDKPVVERLHDVAHKRGLPSSQIALAWMLNNPAITAPIVGATKMEHLDGAVAALSVTLSKDEIDHLEEFYQPHSLPEVMSYTAAGKAVPKNIMRDAKPTTPEDE